MRFASDLLLCVALERERHPELIPWVREFESARHHADNGVALVVHRQRAADDLRIAANFLCQRP